MVLSVLQGLCQCAFKQGLKDIYAVKHTDDMPLLIYNRQSLCAAFKQVLRRQLRIVVFHHALYGRGHKAAHRQCGGRSGCGFGSLITVIRPCLRAYSLHHIVFRQYTAENAICVYNGKAVDLIEIHQVNGFSNRGVRRNFNYMCLHQFERLHHATSIAQFLVN